MNIAVICPSEIAYRRFMPALDLIDAFTYVGIGSASREERVNSSRLDSILIDKQILASQEKVNKFIEHYGAKRFYSYKEVVTSDEVDAVYIPLPPALHYRWAKMALENGKHVLVEKPSTISYDETRDLVETARRHKAALHENYMFVFHNQMRDIDRLIESGEIGEVRLYSMSFGFPRRPNDDFRYDKELGGGALLDAGGYVIKYASRLLGNSARIAYANVNYTGEYDVDIYGSGALVNDEGKVVHISYGMDNEYKCELTVWGNKGYLSAGRVFTAPEGFIPEAMVVKKGKNYKHTLSADNAFMKSIEYFIKCIKDKGERDNNYHSILTQAELVDDFRKAAGK